MRYGGFLGDPDWFLSPRCPLVGHTFPDVRPPRGIERGIEIHERYDGDVWIKFLGDSARYFRPNGYAAKTAAWVFSRSTGLPTQRKGSGLSNGSIATNHEDVARNAYDKIIPVLDEFTEVAEAIRLERDPVAAIERKIEILEVEVSRLKAISKNGKKVRK